MKNLDPIDPFAKHWPSSGGGRHRPKPAPTPVSDEEIHPLVTEQPEESKASPKVALSNLRWSSPMGEFNEQVSMKVDADLPPEMRHLTRIEFSLLALTPDGKRERIDKKEGHLNGGTASAEATLYWPQYKVDGLPLSECDFVFIAKHRESKEEESPPLKVSGPRDPVGKVWIKLVDRKGMHLQRIECELKGKKKNYPKKPLDEFGCVSWDEIPLDEYSAEFMVGAAVYSQRIPWLAKDAECHVQRVKAVNIETQDSSFPTP